MGVPAVIEKAVDDTMPMIANILKSTPGLHPMSFKAALLSQIVRGGKNAEKLGQCTTTSFLNCACTFAGLGVMPDGVSGQACMIAFKDIATPVIMRGGYVSLGDRAGRTIKGNVVREGDEFDWSEGSDEWVKHKRKSTTARITHAWATMTAPNRTPVVAVLFIEELEEMMKRSPAVRLGFDTPYNDLKIGRPAMFEKNGVRRLKRSIPLVHGAGTGQFLVADAVEGKFEATDRPHHLVPSASGALVLQDAMTGDQSDALKPPLTEDPTAPIKLRAIIDAGEPPREFDSVGEWRAALLKLISLNGRRKAALELIGKANGAFLAEASSFGGDYQEAAMQVSEAIAKALAALK